MTVNALLHVQRALHGLGQRELAGALTERDVLETIDAGAIARIRHVESERGLVADAGGFDLGCENSHGWLLRSVNLHDGAGADLVGGKV